MAQRRNPSGRDERSDLTDMKALAAKARSETGGPVRVQNPAELSGVRPRRDSVIGMRLTPPPRATTSELPNWFWGVLGCLSVLLVGFAGLFLLGRSGKLGPLLGEAASLVAPAPAAPPSSTPAPVAAAPIAAAEGPSGPAVAVKQEAEGAEKAEKLEKLKEEAERARRAERTKEAERAAERAGSAERAAPGGAADPAAPPAAGEAPAAAEPAPSVADEGAAAKRAARAPASPSRAPSAKTAEAPAVQDDSAAAADPKTAARPARAAAPSAAAPKAAAADDNNADDDEAAPGQDDVEKALDALATRVRGCFVKYQIKGTARVRLVATPAGKAESVNVTGDFEDTPTGLCVESIVTEAKLPTFKGPPLKLSQSYQLR